MRRLLGRYQEGEGDDISRVGCAPEELQQSRVSVIDAIKQIEESGIFNQHKQLMETIRLFRRDALQIGNPDSEEYTAIESQLNQARMAAMQIEETGVIRNTRSLKDPCTNRCRAGGAR